MKRLMRCGIKSGRVIEEQDVLMETSCSPDCGEPKPRGKKTVKTTLAQLERNMRGAIRQLARLLNCNFQGGDLFLTLKYSPDCLPASKPEAKKNVRNFLRRLDRAYQKKTGRKLRWILVTADRSPKTGGIVRLHHHLVIDADAQELIAANWPAGQFSFRHLDHSGDYSAIARYMIANTGYQQGERSWSSSLGLKKPEFIPPKPIKEMGDFQVPSNVQIVEREIYENAANGFRSAYIRYVLPDKPQKLSVDPFQNRS